jgi:hypothetical protein
MIHHSKMHCSVNNFDNIKLIHMYVLYILYISHKGFSKKESIAEHSRKLIVIIQLHLSD